MKITNNLNPKVTRQLSSPAPGRTMVSLMKAYSLPVLESYMSMLKFFSKNIEHFTLTHLFKTLSPIKDINFSSNQKIKLLISELILIWISSRMVGKLPENTTFQDAINWFINQDSSSKKSIRIFIPIDLENKMLEPLRSLQFDDDFIYILPYIAEVFETYDETALKLGKHRTYKRRGGIYYTPSDLAQYMTEKVAELYRANNTNRTNPPIWMDPACGTGSFLISILRYLIEYKPNSRSNLLKITQKTLYAIDISPKALQSALFITSIFVSMHTKNSISYGSIMNLISSNFALADTTTLNSAEHLSDIFPSLTNGVDIVISNPPYSISKSTSYQYDLFDKGLKSMTNKNPYPVFLKKIIQLTNTDNGVGTMVVPLSIVFSQQPEISFVRNYLLENSGAIYFLNFDRTPDSLFGDDVKTRNTIIFLSRLAKNKKRVYSSELIRWNSRNRYKLFNNICHTEIPAEMCKSIPKISDAFSLEILNRLDSYMNDNKLLNKINEEIEYRPLLIRNSKTAYNWLPFELTRYDQFVKESESKYSYWFVEPPEYTSAVFALLLSRLTYFLWRVWGDGFHLTGRFIESLPYSLSQFSNEALDQLNRLGDQLWAHMRKNSLKKMNAGKLSIAYSPIGYSEYISHIDKIISQQLKLPKTTPEYLKKYVQETIRVSRENIAYW